MSLFDPNTTEERVQQLANDGWWNGSGKPIPALPDVEIRHLEDELLEIGMRVIGSADRASGWDDAYAAFVNAFLRTGAALTEPLFHVDIPNMLFNFSLRNGWFQHLTILKESEPGHLLAPKRIPIEEFATTGPIFHEVHNKRQQLGWFKDRIRPAVLEWSPKTKLQQHNVTQASTVTHADKPGFRTATEMLKDYRKAQSLTWKRFAERFGMSETTMRQRICEPEDKSPIKSETLGPLAKKFGCDSSYFTWPMKNERHFPPLPLA